MAKLPQATLAVLRHPLIKVYQVGRLITQVIKGFDDHWRIYARPVQTQAAP